MTDYAGQAGGGPTVSAERASPGRAPSRFEHAIFVVAPPGSGASLLGAALARPPEARDLDEELDAAIEAIPELRPANRGWDSDRLAAADAGADVAARLDAALPAEAVGQRLIATGAKAALRVPFLHAVFPDALFVYVHREPREAVASAVAAWESGRLVTHPELPGWNGPPWSLALTPEWRKLAGSALPEVAAEQWLMAADLLLRDLDRLPPRRWAVVGYEELIADPGAELERLCRFAGLEGPDGVASEDLVPDAGPDPPDAVLARTTAVAERARDLLAPPSVRAGHGPARAESPYRSVSTASFPQLLAELGSTVLVSTYQTGKLVALRAQGGGLNTHFRPLESPMGIAHRAGRLAVGTKGQVWEYQNLPQLTPKLDPPGRHDACFVPRTVSYTGDVRVHDVAWAGGELWLVATRFSCLATLDGHHSFVPRWRPPFVTALAAEDRCHLNGMAVIDDRVRYVTALGETDAPGGWRENKASGGVLIDVDSGEPVVRGLSMPHSPRWHRGRLWILESGEGSLAAVDLDAGTVETVAKLPGFTRGLAFAGPLAFVGLSEVREATTFGGLPLTARLEERQCGVWVVNVETGATVGFLRFEDLVEEIFDVCLLQGIRFPEIAEHGSAAVDSSFVIPDAASAV